MLVLYIKNHISQDSLVILCFMTIIINIYVCLHIVSLNQVLIYKENCIYFSCKQDRIIQNNILINHYFHTNTIKIFLLYKTCIHIKMKFILCMPPPSE